MNAPASVEIRLEEARAMISRKICLLGASAVGKTSLVPALCPRDL